MGARRYSFQELRGVACSSGVTDEDDLNRRGDIFRDLLVGQITLRVLVPANVVRFLSMKSDDEEIERIVSS